MAFGLTHVSWTPVSTESEASVLWNEVNPYAQP